MDISAGMPTTVGMTLQDLRCVYTFHRVSVCFKSGGALVVSEFKLFSIYDSILFETLVWKFSITPRTMPRSALL